MSTSRSRFAAAVTLISSLALHSLAAALTTWTPVDINVDASLERIPLLAGTHVSPAVIASNLAVSPPEPSYIDTRDSVINNPSAAPYSPHSSRPNRLLPFESSNDHSKPPGMLASFPQYKSLASISKNIIVVFQLIFGGAAALCIILGLGFCLSRLYRNRKQLFRRHPHRHSLSIEMEIGDDVQIVVVKTRSATSGYPLSPTKSALCSPERKASLGLGKSVRWADEVTGTSEHEHDFGNGLDRDLQDLLFLRMDGNHASHIM